MGSRSDVKERKSLWHLVIGFLVSAVVLAITAFLTPGLAISSVWALLIAAAVIGILDYLIERVTGFDASPFGRGILGFVISAAIIYLTGVIVPGVTVTFWGAIIASLVIGIINMIIPGKRVI
ncbi:MAG TPA: phage holin family protein [Clostridia bacterium]|nr:phage holin family protein [Clostridia bacterium]